MAGFLSSLLGDGAAKSATHVKLEIAVILALALCGVGAGVSARFDEGLARIDADLAAKVSLAKECSQFAKAEFLSQRCLAVETDIANAQQIRDEFKNSGLRQFFWTVFGGHEAQSEGE